MREGAAEPSSTGDSFDRPAERSKPCSPRRTSTEPLPALPGAWRITEREAGHYFFGGLAVSFEPALDAAAAAGTAPAGGPESSAGWPLYSCTTKSVYRFSAMCAGVSFAASGCDEP